MKKILYFLFTMAILSCANNNSSSESQANCDSDSILAFEEPTEEDIEFMDSIDHVSHVKYVLELEQNIQYIFTLEDVNGFFRAINTSMQYIEEEKDKLTKEQMENALKKFQKKMFPEARTTFISETDEAMKKASGVHVYSLEEKKIVFASKLFINRANSSTAFASMRTAMKNLRFKESQFTSQSLRHEDYKYYVLSPEDDELEYIEF